MNLDERFWSSTLEELKRGVVADEAAECYLCLVCGESFQFGEIFKQGERLFEAGKYADIHVREQHGSMLEYLLQLDKKSTGLTALQKELVRQFAAGMTDADIAKQAGGSASTVRNHRFVMKEKARQAKLLLAIMDLMEREQGAEANISKFVPIHRTATQVDERYAMTEEENASLLKQYLPNGLGGPLSSFPRKEKRKIAVLRHIASFFEGGMKYAEKEVNERLQRFWSNDYVTLRRYLIQYGFLDREEDGSVYWLKESGKGTLAVVTEAKRSKEPKSRRGKEKVAMSKSGNLSKEQRKMLTAEYQERERSMGVYRITNEKNEKVFIGSSNNLDGLWNRERFILDMGTHMNKGLQQDWKQYGADAFHFEIVETYKPEEKLRYDYKDVRDEEGQELAGVVRDYKKKVDKLKEQWLEKLQPYGEKGYH